MHGDKTCSGRKPGLNGFIGLGWMRTPSCRCPPMHREALHVPHIRGQDRRGAAVAPNLCQGGRCYMGIDDGRAVVRLLPKPSRFDGARLGELVVVGGAKKAVGVGRDGRRRSRPRSATTLVGSKIRPPVAAAASGATRSGRDGLPPEI